MEIVVLAALGIGAIGFGYKTVQRARCAMLAVTGISVVIGGIGALLIAIGLVFT